MKTAAILLAGLGIAAIGGSKLIQAVDDVSLFKLWLLKRQFLKEELPPVEEEERSIIRSGPDSHLHHQQGWLEPKENDQ